MASKSRRRTKLKKGTNAKAQPRALVSVASSPWDMGATGPANRARESRIEDGVDPEVDPDTGEVKTRNPNGVKRRVFYDMLDVYYRRGWITKRGFNAASALRDAWQRTEQGQGNDWSKERVDSTPKPDAAVAVQIDRMSALVAITRHIPPEDHSILLTVACEGHAIGRLRQYRGMNHDKGKRHLHDALERLADRIY